MIHAVPEQKPSATVEERDDDQVGDQCDRGQQDTGADEGEPEQPLRIIASQQPRIHAHIPSASPAKTAANSSPYPGSPPPRSAT